MPNKYFLTIFTPTYNRSYTLERLFKSLLAQTDKGFEWVIVDDGSTDNTGDLVKTFIQQGGVDIQYARKENEGKHLAINRGAELARGEYFFIVDSDDYLTYEAVATIRKYCADIDGKKNFAGVVGLRGNVNGKVIAGRAHECSNEILLNKYGEYLDATCVEYRYKYKIPGDRAEIVATNVIKQFPFPKVEGENFLNESYLWDTLSNNNYQFRWFNNIIYICEYLQDGLTKNMQVIAKKNWKSHILCANLTLNTEGIPIDERIAQCIRYYRYGLYGKIKLHELFNICNNKVLSIAAIPIALLYKVK